VKKLLTLGLLLACAQAATANPIPVTLNSLGHGQDVTVEIIPVGSSGLQTFEAFAGIFNMTLNGNQSFATFCVDTAHEVTVGQTYSVNQELITSAVPVNGEDMIYLYDKYLGAAEADSTGATAAALQLALWALENDQSTLVGPSFVYTGALSAQAQSYITEAINADPSGIVGYWEDASASGNTLGRGQSLIGPSGGVTGNIATPAPSGAVLAITGVALLAGGSLFRRRRLAAAA
jgi:hypothetical protein